MTDPALEGTADMDGLFERAGVAQWCWRPDTGLRWRQSLGSTERPMTRALRTEQDFFSLCHPQDRAKVHAVFERVKAEGGAGEVDYRVSGKDGRWVHLRVTFEGRPLAEGGFGLVGLTQDITELAEARDAAMDVEQRVRGLMEEAQVNARRLKLALGAAQAGVFEIDHETETFWCSPEFVMLIGRALSFDEANRLPWDFIHEDDKPKVLEASKIWMTGALINAPLDVRVIRPDGETRWARLYYELKRDRRGRARRSVGLMLDVDERKRQELALVEAKQAASAAAEAKSHFLASVSHEIRTPMNGVLGVLHLLKSEALSPSGRRLIDEALSCGRMLGELINDVLDFSKIEANQLELAPEPTDPLEVLRGVASLLEPEADAKGLLLRISCPDDIGWVMADPIRLRQSLFNLMGNAVKFTHSGGVDVRLRADGDGPARRLTFEVSDTGVGIAAAAQPHVFRRFHQADSSTTRKFGGTGLGLAITRSLANLMGGDVTFTSVEGQGSTFRLTIDAPAAATPAARASAEPAAGLDGLSVLVVEDNPTNRLVATRILEHLGAQVRTAEDGESGVEAARGGGFDLILMDVQMPGMDGVEATRRIRALPGPESAVPIIALTANVMTHQREAYLAAGMDGVAAKPISPLDLMTEIDRVAQGREPEPQGCVAA